MPPKIEIKGISEGLLVTVSDGEWPEIQRALIERIQAQSEFFAGANLTLDVGELTVKAAALGRLRDQISECGVTLRSVLSTSPQTNETAKTLGLGTFLAKPQPERSGQAFNTTVQGDEAMLVQRTLRSGNNIRFPGHVIVLGDGGEHIPSLFRTL